MNPRGKPLNAASAQTRIFAGAKRRGENSASPNNVDEMACSYFGHQRSLTQRPYNLEFTGQISQETKSSC
jgi:hypothetical protein